MALLHRDKTDESVDNRLGDEGLMGDPPVGGPATVDHDTHRDTDLDAHPVTEGDTRPDTHRDTHRDTTVEREVVVDGASRPEPVDRIGTYGLIARTIVFTLAIVAVVGMAVANPDDVAFDLEFEQYSTPLWAIITIAAALGCIAGLMVRSRSRRSSTSLRR